MLSYPKYLLPKPIADSIRPKGCRLAHLYGLPKTHKEQLAMRPIPSATHTYNYALAKWLDEKLKPLSCNQYTVTDTFEFVNEVQSLEINSGDILVSYDVTSLFTNVPLNESIQILADKAFTDDWFNKTHELNLSRDQLIELLNAATKNQLFQFNGNLYEQTDGVAMGSPLGPLLANVFMYSIEDKLNQDGKLPSYYRQYVDNTLTIMPDLASAEIFLDTLNHCHPSAKFTMEVEQNASLPFIGVELLKLAPRIKTKVYVKPTNTGLLLHYQSHVDNRYKHSLITTMLDRAYRISSDWSYFSQECDRLETVFLKLQYLKHLFNLAVKQFVDSKVADQQQIPSTDTTPAPIRVVIPFKDQVSANIVKKRLTDLSLKIKTTIQPVFISRKLNKDLKFREVKPFIVNQQCLVYQFQCSLCDAGYVGYTRGHLHEHVDGHKQKSSSICKHYLSEHNSVIPPFISEQFHVLTKGSNKFDCLTKEMLFIKKLKPSLNVQADSIHAKVFT